MSDGFTYVGFNPLTIKGDPGDPGPAGPQGEPGAPGAHPVTVVSGEPAIAGELGDLAFRTDLLSTPSCRLYVCFAAGDAGSARWLGIA